MKALHYPAFDVLEVCDRPEPAPGPGEVLLRVAACGVCGSELETFKARSPRRPPPLIMGHEFCGTVETGVAGFRAGQKVVSNALVSCGACGHTMVVQEQGGTASLWHSLRQQYRVPGCP